MDALTALRSHTRSIHERLDSSEMARVLLSPAITESDYVNFLRTSQRVQRKLQPALEAFWKLGRLNYPLFDRLAAIASDLGEENDTVEGRSSANPPAFSEDFLWGMAYAMEGALQGGLMIQRRLATSPLAGRPFRFLGGHGNHAGAYWAEFKKALNSSEREESSLESMIAGAVFVFETYLSLFAGREQCYFQVG